MLALRPAWASWMPARAPWEWTKAAMRCEHRDVLVLPDAQVGGGDAALGDDGGGLDEHEAGAALSAAAEVDQVPVVGEAVVRRVLAHGRDADAVGEGDGAELEGREERLGHDGSFEIDVETARRDAGRQLSGISCGYGPGRSLVIAFSGPRFRFRRRGSRFRVCGSRRPSRQESRPGGRCIRARSEAGLPWR